SICDVPLVEPSDRLRSLGGARPRPIGPGSEIGREVSPADSRGSTKKVNRWDAPRPGQIHVPSRLETTAATAFYVDRPTRVALPFRPDGDSRRSARLARSAISRSPFPP